MKKLLFPLFMLAMIVTSCEKDPDMNKLDSDYSVYTDYDNSVHFNEFSTYYLPDSILVPDNSLKANYWKDENAQNIISAVAHEMEQKGYVRTEDKEKANVGIQLSYAQQRIQIVLQKYTSATSFSVSVTNYYLLMPKLIMFVPDFNRKTT